MAVVNVADGSEVSYNGVTFGTYTQTLSARVRPQYDRAGRTVIYNIISLTVRTIVSTSDSGDATTDDAMELIRRKLTEPGCAFTYKNKGFGDLQINAGQLERDVKWGPKPTMLDWKPLGSNQSVEITWGVEVNIPLCGSGTAKYAFELMEFVYKVDWSIDQSGFNTRTVSGRIAIPLTRVRAGDRRIADSADKYRDRTTPLVPIGYRRVNQNLGISEDKTELSFSYVDTELESYNVPPPGCVKATMSHTIISTVPHVLNNTVIWAGVLQGTFEIVKSAPRALAAKHFFDLLEQRTAGPRARVRQGRTFFLKQLVMTEPNVYGREAGSFQAVYQFLAGAEEVLNASGLWEPVGPDYRLWATSMNDTAFHNRGAYKTGLTDPVRSDSIVDLCLGDNTAKLTPAVNLPNVGAAGVLPVRNPAPAKESSWVQYHADVTLQSEDNVTELKPLPPKAITPSLIDGADAIRGPVEGPGERVLRAVNVGGGGPRTPAALLRNLRRELREAQLRPALAPPDPQAQAYRRTPAAKQKSILQYRTAPRMHVHFRGMAIRAGWLVPPPTLVSYGGRKLAPANGPEHGFAQSVVANWLGMPIVMAEWHYRFLLTELPFKGAPVPKGPHE